MKLRIILFCCFFWLFILHSLSQVFYGTKFEYNGRFSDTIPYKMVEGKIIIEGKIDGKPAKFFIDTGGARSLFSIDSMKYYGAKQISSERISDANGGLLNLSNGYLPNLSLGDHFILNQAPTLFYPTNSFFKDNLGVVGSVGADMLKDIILAIHPNEEYLIIHYPYRPKGRSTEGKIDMHFKNFVPHIKMYIGEDSVSCVFDTGAAHFLSLSCEDYNRIKNTGNIKSFIVANGSFSVGISGDKSRSKPDLGRCIINNLKIGDKQFDDVVTLTHVNNESMMGVDLLKYGNVMIDYQREMFFFFPFDNIVVDALNDTKVWNINIAKERDSSDTFVVDATIIDSGVSVGERIWSINNVRLTDIDLSKMTFHSYMQNLKDDEAEIVVGESMDKSRIVKIKRY